MISLKGRKTAIASEKDADRLLSRLHQIGMQETQFVIATASRLIETEIIDVIHQKMRRKKISKKVIATTFLSTRTNESMGLVSFEVISNHVSDTGFPVAVMVEKGRRKYVVFPRPPTDSRPNPHLSYIISGKRIFSKKSEIPKKPAGNIIRDAVAQGTPQVQRKLSRAYRNWIKEALSS